MYFEINRPLPSRILLLINEETFAYCRDSIGKKQNKIFITESRSRVRTFDGVNVKCSRLNRIEYICRVFSVFRRLYCRPRIGDGLSNARKDKFTIF